MNESYFRLIENKEVVASLQIFSYWEHTCRTCYGKLKHLGDDKFIFNGIYVSGETEHLILTLENVLENIDYGNLKLHLDYFTKPY